MRRAHVLLLKDIALLGTLRFAHPTGYGLRT